MSYDSFREKEYRAILADTTCHLPKHADEPWEDVVKEDPSYAKWAANNLDFNDDLREALLWGCDNRREL